MSIAINKVHDYNRFVNNKLSEVIKMGGRLKEVNVKSDLPTVNDAIRRITFNIRNTGVNTISAVKIIHGYGSTGKGGLIRTEARKYLENQKKRRLIKDYIPGEDFSIFHDATRKALLICGELRRDSDIERHNNGITIIII
jgi:hypothetical protein